jgi:asparagine synthase (glutamine-hydrolysing)
MARSFIAILNAPIATDAETLRRSLRPGLGDTRTEITVVNRNWLVVVSRRRRGEPAMPFSCNVEGALWVGDPSDSGATASAPFMGNCTHIEYSLVGTRLRVTTSITGLPPIFIHRGPTTTAVTSDLSLLAEFQVLPFRFDAAGVADLCRVGFPLENRTLFRGIGLLPAGSFFEIASHAQLTEKRRWAFPAQPVPTRAEYSRLQTEAFRHAMTSLDLSTTFLSLTGGLDTRTVVAALLRQQAVVPCYTLSGEVLSLDARTAARLCREYGFPHSIVSLGGAFLGELPNYIETASRLSAGLASLEQAHEVYFYRQVSTAHSARLAGHIGNQIGRCGVEQVSEPSGDLSLLSKELRAQAPECFEARTFEKPSYDTRWHREIPFYFVANYCIGHHFALQQTPYAHVRMLELRHRRPVELARGRPRSRTQLHARDLLHRFVGPPERHSFQRRFIRETGGFVASCPINWGWRARGGVSTSGLAMGVMAFYDALQSWLNLDDTVAGRMPPMRWSTGLHQFVRPRHWMRTILRGFLHETLQCKDVRESGLFDNARLARLLSEHYTSGHDHYHSLRLALDLALAKATFRATV